jgi:hypothetical protein
MVASMASITLKDIPSDLHGILKHEAEANFRSLSQEVLARLQRSLDLDAASQRDQKWIDEAIASGPEQPFTEAELDAAFQRGLERAKSKKR